MDIQTLSAKEIEYEKEHKLKLSVYSYIIDCINNKNTNEINKEIQKHLFLSSTAKIYSDTKGYIYVKDHKYIYFIFHPVFKEPEVYTYNITKKSRQQRPWKFWKYICIDKVKIIKNDEYKGFPVFTNLTRETFFYIIKYCSVKDLYRSRLVCKKWLELCNCEHIWKRYSLLLDIPKDIPSTRKDFETFVLNGNTYESMIIIAKAWLYKNNIFKSPNDFIYVEKQEYEFFGNKRIRRAELNHPKIDFIEGKNLGTIFNQKLNVSPYIYALKMIYVTYPPYVHHDGSFVKFPIVWVDDNNILKVANIIKKKVPYSHYNEKWVRNIAHYIDHLNLEL